MGGGADREGVCPRGSGRRGRPRGLGRGPGRCRCPAGAGVQECPRPGPGSSWLPAALAALRTAPHEAAPGQGRIGGGEKKQQLDEARPRGAKSWHAASSARPAESAGGAGSRGATHAPLTTGARGRGCVRLPRRQGGGCVEESRESAQHGDSLPRDFRNEGVRDGLGAEDTLRSDPIHPETVKYGNEHPAF